MVNPFEVKVETYWSRSWAGTIKVPTVSGLLAVAFVPVSGERIPTQILWDNKTGKDVTPKDIEKAKKYNEKYDTDHCLIVTEKGWKKGKRDNVILVHPKLVLPRSDWPPASGPREETAPLVPPTAEETAPQVAPPSEGTDEEEQQPQVEEEEPQPE